ncbi:hypothetical protein, partial [Achromobacter pestifer]|uniref:hypothetical protein n=1 Tax=Achromobacter pestifer TaxID=1353889 RepID=UPI001C2E29DD
LVNKLGFNPLLNHSASHQAPTLIGCLIVKERYCKFCTTKHYCLTSYCILLRTSVNFAFALFAVSSAEERDYEGVFIACQISVAFVFKLSFSTKTHCLALLLLRGVTTFAVNILPRFS